MLTVHNSRQIEPGGPVRDSRSPGAKSSSDEIEARSRPPEVRPNVARTRSTPPSAMSPLWSVTTVVLVFGRGCRTGPGRDDGDREHDGCDEPDQLCDGPHNAE